MSFVLIEKWIEALRSGKYKQCKYYLCLELSENDCCHCAVGVLFEEAGLKKNVSTVLKNGVAYDYKTTKIVDRQELADAAMSIGTDLYQIAGKNDSGMTFNQIADFLQSKLDAARASERP